MATKTSALGKVLRYFKRSWDDAFKSVSESSNRKVDFFDIISRMGKNVGLRASDSELESMVKLAVVSSWVYSAVKLIADRAASYEWFTVEVRDNSTDETKPIKDHYFLELFRRPNPLMSGSFLKRCLLNWYCLYGNAYLYLVVDKSGITEMWPLPSNKVYPDPSTIRQSKLDDRTVIDYIYDVDGALYKLSGEYVVHFRTVNIFDYWLGLSPLTAIQLPLRTDFSQSMWLDSFFGKENAIPAAIISLPADLPDSEFDAVRLDLQEQFGGGRKTAVTRAGDLNIEVIQQAIGELRVLEGRTFNQQEIDRVYGVPEGMITSGLSGDSRLAAEISFARNSLKPILDTFVDDLNRTFTPFMNMKQEVSKAGNIVEVTSEQYVLRATEIVPQDQALDINEYNAYRLDRTLNENRKKHKDDPIKLKGIFVDLQVLLDEVPLALFDLVAPPIIEKWAADNLKPAGGAEDAFAELDEEDEVPVPPGGPPPLPEKGGKPPAKPGAVPEGATPGYRNSGQLPPDAVQGNMTGKATSPELDTLAQVMRLLHAERSS